VRFRYATSRRERPIYWRDRNLKFHRCDLVEPSRAASPGSSMLSTTIAGIFWG